MRIDSSSIQLSGSSTSVQKQSKDETLKAWVGNTRPVFPDERSGGNPLLPAVQSGDTLKLSSEGKAALEKQMAAASSMGAVVEEDGEYFELSDKDKQKIYLLQRMIEAFTGKKFKFYLPKDIKADGGKNSLQAVNVQNAQVQAVQVRQRNGWGLEYDLHESYYEKQTLSFSAEGSVKTADGREIKLDLDLNMSREFSSNLNVSVRAGDAVQKVDPLVINYGGPTAALTNSKFSFDLDNDGDSEQISFATAGSGFLAFDVNQDGTINNGSELFGPQSGNGFGELTAYDGDSNGWIDENDEIYNKLRIWTKDENGNDRLFALGEKGVGAIYLGNVATTFDMKTTSNQTLGSIARTGIYLNENGTAGTIQHVDLAV